VPRVGRSHPGSWRDGKVVGSCGSALGCEVLKEAIAAVLPRSSLLLNDARKRNPVSWLLA